MMKTFSLDRAQVALRRAVDAATLESAENFAQTLRRLGEHAAAESAPEGAVRVILEGAGAVAREFGTRAMPARPFLAPALAAERGRLHEMLERAIVNALKGRS